MDTTALIEAHSIELNGQRAAALQALRGDVVGAAESRKAQLDSGHIADFRKCGRNSGASKRRTRNIKPPVSV
jgi:hypothetical protein